jgi:hypothetical protein
LGFFAKEYTPTYRGFDSYFGFWTDTEDYYSHVSYDNGYGLDLRRDLQVLFDSIILCILDKYLDNYKYNWLLIDLLLLIQCSQLSQVLGVFSNLQYILFLKNFVLKNFVVPQKGQKVFLN